MNKNYDSTVARIAGNIASGLVNKEFTQPWEYHRLAEVSVTLARAIVAEVKRTAKLDD